MKVIPILINQNNWHSPVYQFDIEPKQLGDKVVLYGWDEEADVFVTDEVFAIDTPGGIIKTSVVMRAEDYHA